MSRELCFGTGRTFEQTTSATVCRCEASENEPLFDGSHARVGFMSE